MASTDAPAALPAEGLPGSGEAERSLLVDVAHDLRSPLTSILFLLERVRSGQSGPLTPLMERQLALVHSAAFGLSAVVEDLMLEGRSGIPMLEAPPAPYRPAQLLAEVGDIIGPIAAEKGVGVDLAPGGDAMHLGNRAATRRVLLNLATNAVKFSGWGAIVLAVEATAAGLRYRVEDRGRGMPPERGEGAGFSSSGLGLAICHRLVAGMGGTLSIDSRPGVGTRCLVELPHPAA